MADFYANLKSTASKLLQSKGQQVTFTRSVEASFDPATGIKTEDTDITFAGYGAAFDYNKTEIDGEIVQAGDIRFLMEATDTAPALGDTTTIDSIIYRVMNVEVTSPAGTAVIYTVQLRK